MTENSQNHPQKLELNVSRSLYVALLEQAEDEGIDLDSYCLELLAAGAVKKAWDTFGPQTKMTEGYSGGISQPRNKPHQKNRPHKKNSSRPGQNRRNGSSFSKGNGGGQSKYDDIMNEQANFMAYVRSQE